MLSQAGTAAAHLKSDYFFLREKQIKNQKAKIKNEK
jgi:hypothetical protein